MRLKLVGKQKRLALRSEPIRRAYKAETDRLVQIICRIDVKGKSGAASDDDDVRYLRVVTSQFSRFGKREADLACFLVIPKDKAIALDRLFSRELVGRAILKPRSDGCALKPLAPRERHDSSRS